MTQRSEFQQFLKYLGFSLLIAFGFFLTSFPKIEGAEYGKVAIISLIYSVPIFLSIYSSFTLVGWGIDLTESKTGKSISFGFLPQLMTSSLGLIIGILIAEFLKAAFLDREVILTSAPKTFLIGTFISLVFLFYNEKAAAQSEKKELAILNAKLKAEQAKKEKTFLERITTKIGDQVKVLPLESITCFTSANHYTSAHTLEGEYIIDYSLKALEEELDPKKWLRLHRNSLVRLETIKKVESQNNWTVILESGKSLTVSRSKRKQLKDSL